MTDTDRISLLLRIDLADANLDSRLDKDDEAVLESYREELEQEVAAALEKLRLEGADDELLSRREAELADKVEDALATRARELAENHLSDLQRCGATHFYAELSRTEARGLLGYCELAHEDFRAAALPIDLNRADPAGELSREEGYLAYRLEISLTPRGRNVAPDAFVDLGDGDTITFAGKAGRALHGLAAQKAVAPPVALEPYELDWIRGYSLRTVDGIFPCLNFSKLVSALWASAEGEELREYFCTHLASDGISHRDLMERVEEEPDFDFGVAPFKADFRSRLRAALEPEDLMPLLRSEDDHVRQEAMMLLDERRQSEPPDADALTPP